MVNGCQGSCASSRGGHGGAARAYRLGTGQRAPGPTVSGGAATEAELETAAVDSPVSPLLGIVGGRHERSAGCAKLLGRSYASVLADKHTCLRRTNSGLAGLRELSDYCAQPSLRDAS